MPRMVQMICSQCKEVYTVASVAKNCKKCGEKGSLVPKANIVPGAYPPEVTSKEYPVDAEGIGPITVFSQDGDPQDGVLLTSQGDPALNGVYVRPEGIECVERVAGEHMVMSPADPDQKPVPVSQESQSVAVSVPVDHVTVGFAPLNSITFYFTSGEQHERPRAFLRGALSALMKSETRLATGRPVKNHGDVVVWILEQLADNCDLPLSLKRE